MCYSNKRTRQVHEVHTVDSDNEEDDGHYFLGECVGTSSNCDKWNVNLMLCNNNINFKVDTGADVTVMTYECYQNISPKPILIKSKRKLFTPAGKLNYIVIFHCDMSYLYVYK